MSPMQGARTQRFGFGSGSGSGSGEVVIEKDSRGQKVGVSLIVDVLVVTESERKNETAPWS